jgi:hypothetical protein
VHIAGATLALQLRSATIPVEQAAALGATERFLTLAETDVRIHYMCAADPRAGVLDMQADGRLRDATFQLSARLNAGELEGRLHRAEVRFEFDDILDAALDVRELEVPTADQYPAFLNAPVFAGPIAAIFRDYEPRGRADLHLSIGPRSAAGDPAARITGTVWPRGGSCRYRHFPYPIDDVQGQVRFADGGVYFDALRGRHAGALVEMSGRLNDTYSWTGFDLEFRASNLPLNEPLYAALPPAYQELWRQAQPVGVCDVLTRVRRAEGDAAGGPRTPVVTVTAQLLGGALSLGEDQRIDHADGWICVDDGMVHLRDVHGFTGSAALRLDGDVNQASDDGSRVSFAMYDLPVRHSIGGADDDDGPAAHLAGLADAWGEIRISADTKRHQHVAAQLKSGVLQGGAQSANWLLGTGLVRVWDELWEVLRLTAHQGPARLELAGSLSPTAPPGEPLALSLVAAAPALEKLFPQFLPADWLHVVDELGMEGAGQVQVRLLPAAGARGQAAEIECSVDRLRPRCLPLDLCSASAAVRLAPGEFRVARAYATWGSAGQIELRQEEAGGWNADGLFGRFSVNASDFSFSPALVGALPPPLADVCTRLSLCGDFDLELPEVQLRPSPGELWRVTGRGALRNAGLRVGIDLAVDASTLWGTCAANSMGEVELDAAFTITQGVLDGRPIADWEGRMLRVAGDRWIRLENLSGRLCDGVAQGSVHIDLDNSTYELALKLHDVTADGLLPAAGADRPRPGRVDGEFWLRGQGGDPGVRQGGGKLRVRGASYLHLPVLASIIQLRPGTTEEVEWADVRFLLAGREVRLERIDIHGRDLRLVGEGTCDLVDQHIDLTFVAAHPRNWPRVGVLSELVESAGRELVQYRVDGLLDAPRVRAAPLHRLSEPVLRLLRGDE